VKSRIHASLNFFLRHILLPVSKKTKILQAISLFYPSSAFGGAARVSYAISKELAKRGHEITVLTTDGYDRETRLKVRGCFYRTNGLRVEYLRNIVYKPSMNIFIAPDLARVAKREIRQCDVIHLHDYRSFLSLITIYYAKKFGIPCILQAHGQLPRIVAKQKLKLIYDVLFGYRLLRDASKVIALSSMEAEQYRDMGVCEKKIAIVPNGIDLSEYANLPNKGAFKQKLGINKDEKIILYLGRIHRSKGIDFLVRSFDYLTKNCIDKAKLVIAGPDDGYINEIRALVYSLGLNEKVLFTGLLGEKDKIGAFVDCTICAYLNPREPFGLVPLEAALCCRPVVVAANTPISEIVKQGNFGFSVKYGDITAFTKTAEKILQDEKLANEIGMRGRGYVSANFDWSNIVVTLTDLYEGVAKAKPKCFARH
jgi:glycosyltransferase involved in cell wall biosynthesis